MMGFKMVKYGPKELGMKPAQMRALQTDPDSLSPDDTV